MKNYIKSSLKRELMFSFILVAILPLIISSFFMIRIFKIKIETAQRKEIETHLTSMEQTLTGYFQDLNFITQELHHNDLINKALYEQTDEKLLKAHQILFNLTYDLRKVAQFELYSKDGVCKSSTSTKISNSTLPTYWGILRAAADKPDTLVIRVEKDYQDTTSDILLRTARVIIDESGYIKGYIVTAIKSDAFSNILNGKYDSKDSVAILDMHLNTVYSTEQKSESSLTETLKQRILSGAKINDLAKENNFFIKPLGDTSLYLILQRDEFFTSDISKTMYNISAIITVLSLMLCTVLSLKLSKNLFRPIYIMKDAMHKVEKGQLDTQIETDRMDELGELTESFNTMVNKLRNYMKLKVKQQQKLNESNIAMMQAQLNPHFVYNTLDTIKWVAKDNNIPEIVTLVTGLAKILRTSISSAHLITLKKELAIVKSYMDIQQLRFSGKFKFTTEIPNELENCIIPKLTIQPLVENAIIHGLSDRDEGHIHITAYTENNMLSITVTDDGCGISCDIINLLNSKGGKRLEDKIGIYNIDTIIKLRYGEEFGVYLESGENSGTNATVMLPVIIQEDTNYDKGIDYR